MLLQWLLPWEFSWSVLLVTLLAAWLYITGCSRCRVAAGQKVCFWAGLFSLYAVCHTQLEYYAEHEFFAHQLQSLVLHHLGPFLLALSRPELAMSAACPEGLKCRFRRIAVRPPVSRMLTVWFHPLFVTLLFVSMSALWLLPSVHLIAMLDWRLHALMNAGMTGSGLMFWGGILQPYGPRSTACRIAMLLAVVVPQILIGVLIFLAPQELYPIYSLCGRAFAGMSSLADQQIGGLILWMHAAMMSVIGVLIVIRREWRQAQAA